MILTDTPKLIMHYAPGLLVTLKREPCPGQNGPWGVYHGSCGCEKPAHQIFKVAKVHLLNRKQEAWVLSRCWLSSKPAEEVAV